MESWVSGLDTIHLPRLPCGRPRDGSQQTSRSCASAWALDLSGRRFFFIFWLRANTGFGGTHDKFVRGHRPGEFSSRRPGGPKGFFFSSWAHLGLRLRRLRPTFLHATAREQNSGTDHGAGKGQAWKRSRKPSTKAASQSCSSISVSHLTSRMTSGDSGLLLCERWSLERPCSQQLVITIQLRPICLHISIPPDMTTSLSPTMPSLTNRRMVATTFGSRPLMRARNKGQRDHLRVEATPTTL